MRGDPSLPETTTYSRFGQCPPPTGLDNEQKAALFLGAWVLPFIFTEVPETQSHSELAPLSSSSAPGNPSRFRACLLSPVTPFPSSSPFVSAPSQAALLPLKTPGYRTSSRVDPHLSHAHETAKSTTVALANVVLAMVAAAIISDGEIHGRSLLVFAVTTATITLTAIFVGARIICRYFIVRNVTWDDKIVILAWLLAFSLSFIIDFGVFHGLGRDENDISDGRRSILHKCEYIFSVLYNPALMATKSSILVLYLRITKNTRLLLRHTSWFMLGIVNLAGFILTFINIFQCRPIEAGWALELYQSNASCIPLLIEFICASPVNIITDLAILILPIPVLTSMRLPLRQKVILILAFALGVFVTVVGVVRIYYLQHAVSERSARASIGFDPEGDQIGSSPNAAYSLMWSAVEVNIGITCACIPTIKPLVLKLLPNILNEQSSTRRSSRAPVESQEPMCQIMSPRCKSVEQKSLEISTDSPTTPGTVQFGDGSQDVVITPATSATAVRTNPTSPTTGTLRSGTSFDFVKTNRTTTSMVKTNRAESFRYCAIVSLLFFLCGMSYGLLDNVNGAVAMLNDFSPARNIGLSTVYSGVGYFFGPLLAGEFLLQDRVFIKRRAYETDSTSGYKMTFIVGLVFFGIGAITFWPSAVKSSYGGFMLSNLFIGFGLGVIEVGANSFMVLCGPPDYAETRVLIAQAIQGFGNITNSLLAQRVFLKDIDTSGKATLVSVQWVYLGITLFSAILGLFYFYVPLPDVGDDELKELSTRLQVDPKKKTICGLQLRTMSLFLAVFTQYMFSAAQVSNFSFFEKLFTPAAAKDAVDVAESPGPDRDMTLSISNCILAGRAGYTFLSLILAYIAYLSVSISWLPRPRTYLASGIALSFVLYINCVVFRPSNPNKLVFPSILVFVAETPIAPLLFAFGLRGQGRRTKRAAGFITMGESGPALVPFIMHGILSAGGSIHTAYIVLVAVMAAAMVYPAYLLLSRSARAFLKQYSDVQGTHL